MAGVARNEGRMGRGRPVDDDNEGFKSKNLEAERRRRVKLSSRLLELRSVVPIITNMNKATIITDAITYIHELQGHVSNLSDQLFEMEATIEQELKTESSEIDSEEEMKKWGIEPEVKVTQMDANKLWIKIVFAKKRGGFTKLMEAMTVLGFYLADTSVTTSKGAVLVTSSVEGVDGGILVANQITEMLLEIMRAI